MARRRMVDPNIWQSEDFASLSLLAKLVFIGMFSNADDAGRGRAKAVYLRSILFPYEEGPGFLPLGKKGQLVAPPAAPANSVPTKEAA